MIQASAHISMLFTEHELAERPAAAAAAGFGAVECYLLATPTAVAELLDEVGVEAVAMLYDAYHAARAGLDPALDVLAFAGRIGHVQFADCPGRGAPGTGALDLGRFVDSLERLGYIGAIGFEFVPAGPVRAESVCAEAPRLLSAGPKRR